MTDGAGVAAAASTSMPGSSEPATTNYLGAHPTAEDLDRVAQGRPVYLVHASRHMGVANTHAFELAGFPGRVGVPVPPGGGVPIDSSGRAIGLLEEAQRIRLRSDARHRIEHVSMASDAQLARMRAVGIIAIP